MIYDLIEYSNLAFSGWENEKFLCQICYNDNHISDHGQKKIDEMPRKDFVQIASFPLGQNTLRDNDLFHQRKGEEKALLQQLKARKSTLNIEFMSQYDILHFTFHKRHQIRELVEWVRKGGLKNGTKLTILDKVFVYLVRLRTNIPSKSLAYFYAVDVSTIQRAFRECERAISQFSHEFGSCYNPDEIIAEKTTEYAKLAHGDDKIILSIDGTYLYRNVFII